MADAAQESAVVGPNSKSAAVGPNAESAAVGPNFSSGEDAGGTVGSGNHAGEPELKFGPTYVAAVGISIYLGLTAILLWLSLTRTGGEFTYAQDDPYIHLAMARNLAEHGVWGIRPHEFASASSSPLWTLLLAAIWKIGVHAAWLPFSLNLIFGVAATGVAACYLASLSRHALAAVAVIVVVAPLPTLALIGMEHTLQVLLVLIFAEQASKRLAADRNDWLAPSIVAALMVATRYESLFLVAVVCLALLWQRRVLPAAILGALAAGPVALFAAYSVAHGGLILPNSVLMKSVPGRFSTLQSGVAAVLSEWLSVRDLFLRPPQLAMTIAVLVGLLLTPAGTIKRADRAVCLSVLFLGTSLLHACLVKLEWFFRYEAYLLALGVLTLAALAVKVEWPRGVPRKRLVPLHPALLPLLVLLSLPLAVRALTALATTATAAQNIYEQQIQLGRFFDRHYAGRAIAVNDLGAVAWLSSSRILDIVGLASQPVADLKRKGALEAAALERLARDHDVEAIALYENVFRPILPRSWIKVGEWTISGNVAVSGATVSFFAADEAGARRLATALRQFDAELPSTVRASTVER